MTVSPAPDHHATPLTTVEPGMPALRIVIPAHDEEHRIDPTVRDYCAHFGARARIVVVANACRDRTVAILQRLAADFPNLDILDIPAPIGKGGAIRAGFKLGHEPHIGFTDADHSTTAAEFDRLYEACVATSACGVIGSRWLPESIVGRRQPTQRIVAGRTFNLIVRSLFGLPFSDTQCGAKVFRRDAIAQALPALELADFAFDIDLLTNLRSRKCRVLEMPTVWCDSLGATTIRRLGHTSLAMLSGILRLRLRRSILERIPYVASMARESVIPVGDRMSVLVLRNESAADGSVDAYVDAAVAHWLEDGHVVHTVTARGLAGRIGVFAWYAFASPRAYDAVIEVESGIPFFIPALSVKATYLIERRPASGRGIGSAAYAALYRHVARVAASSPLDAVPIVTVAKRVGTTVRRFAFGHFDDFLRHARVNGGYQAAFTLEDGSWRLTFRDSGTGMTIQQAIETQRFTA